MRYAIALAIIPVAVWAAWPKPAPMVVAKAVAIEGVTARKMDESSFARRFALVPEGGDAVAPNRNHQFEKVPAGNAAASSAPPPARLMRRAVRLRVNGICARHGMRKVTYGKRWRCRK